MAISFKIKRLPGVMHMCLRIGTFPQIEWVVKQVDSLQFLIPDNPFNEEYLFTQGRSIKLASSTYDTCSKEFCYFRQKEISKENILFHYRLFKYGSNTKGIRYWGQMRGNARYRGSLLSKTCLARLGRRRDLFKSLTRALLGEAFERPPQVFRG